MFTNLEHNIILLLVSVDPRPLLLPLLMVVSVSGWQEVVWQLVRELVTITLHLETIILIIGT